MKFTLRFDAKNVVKDEFEFLLGDGPHVTEFDLMNARTLTDTFVGGTLSKSNGAEDFVVLEFDTTAMKVKVLKAPSY
jgi:hypothetical protein